MNRNTYVAPTYPLKSRVDTSNSVAENRHQERETDCHQVAIVGVRNPVDDLKISVRVRPLLPCLREHNIKQLFREGQPIKAALFVWTIGNVETVALHADACSDPFCHSS